MAKSNGWTREQLLVAFYLYCKIPFGRFHSSNPELIEYASHIGRTPSALAMKLSNIASLDPSFRESGRKGLDGASIADKAMWQEMSQDWDTFAEAVNQALIGFQLSSFLPPEPPQPDFTGENREVLTKVRVGQSLFRGAVLSAYENRCCISGLAIPELLVASHIKPWSASPENRRNPANGLCLSTLHDKAFDRGLVCVNDDFTLRIANRWRHWDDPFWQSAVVAYEGKEICLPKKFQPERDLLAYHREKIFVN